MFNISYDPKAKALYIELIKDEGSHEIEEVLRDKINCDYSVGGQLIGIEILNVE